MAEFDSNRYAHIAMGRSTSSLIEDARFILNDRNSVGHIYPPVGIQFGSTGNPRSMLQSSRIFTISNNFDHP